MSDRFSHAAVFSRFTAFRFAGIIIEWRVEAVKIIRAGNSLSLPGSNLFKPGRDRSRKEANAGSTGDLTGLHFSLEDFDQKVGLQGKQAMWLLQSRHPGCGFKAEQRLKLSR
jgi:hypothetical protein